ncbi:MAG TPA: nucleotide sugar dehydrogenase [Caldilinea sp.]|nr:nucleotide sugar dehydrogenase [Caldilinea sp.]
MSRQAQLIARFAARDAHVAVIGLGYVGLPLAVAFAEAGYRVTGIDLDARKVDAINRGESYIEDVPAAAVAALVKAGETERQGEGEKEMSLPPTPLPHPPAALSAGRLFATTDYSALATCDAASICVPTPLNKTGDPDISYIINATEQIARHLHPDMVIVLESTTYPGTTTEVMLPLLKKGGGRGAKGEAQEGEEDAEWQVGVNFFLAFSPERVDPGRTDWTTRNTPKVMGGVTPACLAVASAYYCAAIETLAPVSSPEAAEMVKLFENTFRSVNIGLANELLLMCDKLGLDAWEIIEAAATKPFGFMKFTPGPGLGGHCIPIDPLYLSWKLRTMQYHARFIELASEINTEMPRYWVQKVQDALNDAGKAVKGSRILVLGVAYKKNVSDLRESPALDIIHLLGQKGATVSYHDPHVPAFEHEGIAMRSMDDLDTALAEADCVVIATDHAAYDWAAVQQGARLLVDTRHVVPG